MSVLAQLRKVVLRKTGLCQWCSEPFRGQAHPMARQPFLTCKTEGTHE